MNDENRLIWTLPYLHSLNKESGNWTADTKIDSLEVKLAAIEVGKTKRELKYKAEEQHHFDKTVRGMGYFILFTYSLPHLYLFK